MRSYLFTLALVILFVITTVSSAPCYPTSANIIPTADILDAGSMRLEYENDGYPKVGDGDSTTYWFSQFGLTPQIEVGIDRYDASGDSQDSFNAKYLVKVEDDLGPAVAVGVMDIAKDSSTSYYAVSTKTLGKLRLHAGYIHTDYSKGPMLGTDLEVGKGTWFLADWLKGDENYLTFGVYKEFTNRWAVTLMYGLPNDSDYEKLSGVNVSYTVLMSLTGK